MGHPLHTDPYVQRLAHSRVMLISNSINPKICLLNLWNNQDTKDQLGIRLIIRWLLRLSNRFDESLSLQVYAQQINIFFANVCNLGFGFSFEKVTLYNCCKNMHQSFIFVINSDFEMSLCLCLQLSRTESRLFWFEARVHRYWSWLWGNQFWIWWVCSGCPLVSKWNLTSIFLLDINWTRNCVSTELNPL